MSPLQALHALGLDVIDVAVMRIELLDALADATAELLRSFQS